MRESRRRHGERLKGGAAAKEAREAHKALDAQKRGTRPRAMGASQSGAHELPDLAVQVAQAVAFEVDADEQAGDAAGPASLSSLAPSLREPDSQKPAAWA